jgi:hypothetical protein
LLPCLFVAADALLEIGKAVVSTVLLLDEHLSQNFVTSRCEVMIENKNSFRS